MPSDKSRLKRAGLALNAATLELGDLRGAPETLRGEGIDPDEFMALGCQVLREDLRLRYELGERNRDVSLQMAALDLFTLGFRLGRVYERQAADA